MSTSISLGTSADLESLTSRSFRDIENNRAAELKTEPKFLGPSASNQLHAQRKFIAHPSQLPLRNRFYLDNSSNQAYIGGRFVPKNGTKADFYEEVDERMSRNSFEYPEQQAKYVGKWLNNIDSIKSRSIEDDSSRNWGNVIGIRGFGSATNEESREGEQQRAKYNRLKFDHLKLQSDYEKLNEKLREMIAKFKRENKKKNYDIEVLRTLVERLGRKSTGFEHRERRECTCNCNRDQQTVTLKEPAVRPHHDEQEEVERLKLELRRLETKLSFNDEEHEEKLRVLKGENDRLREQAGRTKNELDNELEGLRNQIRALSLEPNVKMVHALRSENCRLKDIAEVDAVEFQKLKENYKLLESQWKSMVEDQKCLDEEKNDEMQKLLHELCRLQVYQPKLEMMLETERQVKAELRNKIEQLQKDNEKLQEQMKNQNLELNQERIRAKKTGLVEVDRLQLELANWQEKYYRLKKEKSDVDDLLRTSKSKVAQLDSRYQSEIDLVKESSRVELNKMRSNVLKLEEERNRLLLEIDRLTKKLSECEMDKEQLKCEILETNRKLEGALNSQRSNEAALRKLKESEERVLAITNQLKAAESKTRDMQDELANCRHQLERSNKQIEQLQHRFQLQQQTFDSMNENKDKELTKLRVNLNFEQYNRQVALKGIEKELRVSLKELEAMKYRFSRRLAQSDPVEKTSRVHLNNPSSPSSRRGSATTSNTARLIAEPIRGGDTSP